MKRLQSFRLEIWSPREDLAHEEGRTWYHGFLMKIFFKNNNCFSAFLSISRPNKTSYSNPFWLTLIVVAVTHSNAFTVSYRLRSTFISWNKNHVSRKLSKTNDSKINGFGDKANILIQKMQKIMKTKMSRLRLHAISLYKWLKVHDIL